MVKPLVIDFGTQSDPGRFGPDSGPRLINARVENVQEGKDPLPIYPTEGLTLFGDTAIGLGVRGIKRVGANLYVVAGQQLYRVDNTGAAAAIGGVPGTEPVIMARNNKPGSTQLVIVAEGLRFFVENDVLAEITDPDLPAPSSCDVLNGRILFGVPDGRFFWAALDETTDIDALDFATAEGNPDGNVRLIQHLQEVWIFGEESIEVWRDTGDSSNLYVRNQGVVIPKGCASKHSVVKLDKDLFWLGNDFVVYAASGYGFERVSHFGVEESIKQTADKSSITATGHFTKGHAYYTISGPDWTWEFNRTMGRWHERTTNGSRWCISAVERFNGANIGGDCSNGKLYTIDQDVFSEDGVTRTWEIRSAPFGPYPNRMTVHRLYLDMVVGKGLNTSDPHASQPEVMLDWSDDGGHNWSSVMTKSIGKIGEYRKRVAFGRLGATGRTGRIWRVRVSSPVPVALMSHAMEATRIGT